MRELHIQKYLRAHGLQKTVEDFKLAVNQSNDGELMLFKYNQIESPMAAPEVQECRGIILKMSDWSVVSMPFTKFFNAGEGNAHEVNWATAKVFKKYDGSLLTLYNYKGEWRVSTTGTPDADSLVNNRAGMTFSSLFFDTLSKYSPDLENLPTECSYMFELCTPYNIVVTPHGESKLILLGARNLKDLTELLSLEEISENWLHVPVAEHYNFRNEDVIRETFYGMPFSEEGYVVRDTNFNRVKIKNPAYVAAHHLKDSTAEYKIVAIIKSNEVDEYAATFPERDAEIRDLERAYHMLIEEIDEGWKELVKMPWRKDYAMSVIQICEDKKWATGLYFSLMAHGSFVDHLRKEVRDMDDKRLYGILQNIVKSTKNENEAGGPSQVQGDGIQEG